MSWKETDRVSERREFVKLSSRPDTNFAALCRRFGITRKTGYKWLTSSSNTPKAAKTTTTGSLQTYAVIKSTFHGKTARGNHVWHPVRMRWFQFFVSGGVARSSLYHGLIAAIPAASIATGESVQFLRNGISNFIDVRFPLAIGFTGESECGGEGSQQTIPISNPPVIELTSRGINRWGIGVIRGELRQ